MSAPGRRLAFAAFLALLGVLAFGATRWREIAETAFLWRLEADPGLLQATLDAPEGGVKHRAILRFLDTPAGKEALFRVFMERVCPPGGQELGIPSGAPPLAVTIGENVQVTLAGWSLVSAHGGGPPPWIRWLAFLEGSELASRDYPGYRFVFFKAGRPYAAHDAHDAHDAPPAADAAPRAPGWTCLVLPAGPGPPPRR